MKARGCHLRTSWLLNVSILCILFILSPMALMANPASAQSTYDDSQAYTVNEPTAAGVSSVYDGTYTGTFNYQYREGDGPSYSLRGWTWSDWEKDSFTLTVTLEPYMTGDSTTQELYAKTLGYWMKRITSVSCSEPAFGTGAGSIAPFANDITKQSTAMLPLNTGIANPSLSVPLGINIFFPNGSVIITLPSSLSVSSDRQTLSNSPKSIPDENSTWSVLTAPSGIFQHANEPMMVPGASVVDSIHRVEVDYISWSLTKQTIIPITTTKPATTTTPPGVISFGPPSQGGEVDFREPGYDWKTVSPFGQVMPVSDGSAVRTGQGSVVMTDFPGQGDQVFVGENTEFQIEELGTALDNLLGKIRVSIILFGKKFEVRTPTGVIAVRGTDFIIDATPEQTRVLVFEGTVEFSDLGKNKTVLVNAGEYSVVAAGGLPAAPQKIDTTAVFQQYKPLFASDAEIKAIIANLDKTAKSGEVAGLPIYVIVAIVVILIAAVIVLVIRQKRPA
jgi:hypothetical protein